MINKENIEELAKRITNEKDYKKARLLCNLISKGIELEECEKLLKLIRKDINVKNISVIQNLMSNKTYLECYEFYKNLCEILEDEK